MTAQNSNGISYTYNTSVLWWTLRIGNIYIQLSKVNYHIVISQGNTVIWATRTYPARPTTHRSTTSTRPLGL